MRDVKTTPGNQGGSALLDAATIRHQAGKQGKPRATKPSVTPENWQHVLEKPILPVLNEEGGDRSPSASQSEPSDSGKGGAGFKIRESLSKKVEEVIAAKQGFPSLGAMKKSAYTFGKENTFHLPKGFLELGDSFNASLFLELLNLEEIKIVEVEDSPKVPVEAAEKYWDGVLLSLRNIREESKLKPRQSKDQYTLGTMALRAETIIALSSDQNPLVYFDISAPFVEVEKKTRLWTNYLGSISGLTSVQKDHITRLLHRFIRSVIGDGINDRIFRLLKPFDTIWGTFGVVVLTTNSKGKVVKTKVKPKTPSSYRGVPSTYHAWLADYAEQAWKRLQELKGNWKAIVEDRGVTGLLEEMRSIHQMQEKASGKGRSFGNNLIRLIDLKDVKESDKRGAIERAIASVFKQAEGSDKMLLSALSPEGVFEHFKDVIEIKDHPSALQRVREIYKASLTELKEPVRPDSTAKK